MNCKLVVNNLQHTHKKMMYTCRSFRFPVSESKTAICLSITAAFYSSWTHIYHNFLLFSVNMSHSHTRTLQAKQPHLRCDDSWTPITISIKTASCVHKPLMRDPNDPHSGSLSSFIHSVCLIIAGLSLSVPTWN